VGLARGPWRGLIRASQLRPLLAASFARPSHERAPRLWYLRKWCFVGVAVRLNSRSKSRVNPGLGVTRRGSQLRPVRAASSVAAIARLSAAPTEPAGKEKYIRYLSIYISISISISLHIQKDRVNPGSE